MEAFISAIPNEKRWIFEQTMNDINDHFDGVLRFKETEWKGHRFLPGFEAETAKYAYEKLEVEQNSVFLASFPKTGVNWTSAIVSQLLYGPNGLGMFPPLEKMELVKASKFQLLEYLPVHPKCFQTHLPENLVNVAKIKKSGGKIIVILRNPKDQAVSWYHFCSKSGPFDNARYAFSLDWPQFSSDYIQGKQLTFMKDGDCYAEHILGWYKHKDEDNVMFIYYEDMKRDTKQEIRRLAKFLNVEVDDKRVEEIENATTFSVMKQTSHPNLSKINLFRKGEVGNWKQLMTVAQSELMDKLIENKLGHTDIKFVYELK
uniref:sulfotransferase 6B1-like isoform X1 n=1 Tax=Styela clava TaxID=7725 RepID=UPI0019397850|nr:sulfotransferase 6B1-like isoform X1 [Styela clava]